MSLETFLRKLFPPTPKKKEPYECHNSFKIAGVTFKNKDGSSRQSILKKIKDFDKAELKVYEYNGKQVIGVYTTDGKQVGNIKEKDIPYVLNRLETKTDIVFYNINSFYSFEDKKDIWYGEIIIFFMQ